MRYGGLNPWKDYVVSPGNSTTGNCCSSCWRAAHPEEPKKAVAKESPATKATPVAPIDTPVADSEPTAMDIEETKKPTTAPIETSVDINPSPDTKTKKKKKKANYRNMMAVMLESSKDGDIEKEKDTLRKVTGGGQFSKVEKI
eukprot:scaffold19891_cov44-Attheya_sp.AAC.2